MKLTELKLEVQLGLVLAVAVLVAAAIYVRELAYPDPGPSPVRVVDLKFRIAANEAAAIRDIRTLMAAQEAYRAANSGFYDGNLDCLAAPAYCIPSYPATAPTFLDSQLASTAAKLGYNRSFLGAEAPSVIPARSSPSSRSRFRYDATATMVGVFGARGFAGASDGRICFTTDGSPVPLGPDEATLPADCRELREDETPGAAQPQD